MSTDTANLVRLHNALTAALPQAGARQLADGPTADELALEAAFALALQSPLRSTYAFALRGIAEVEDEDEDAVFAWIADRFRNEPAEVAALVAVLFTYGRRAFDVGGALGLAEMGLARPFRLTNAALINALREYASSLTDVDADISLTRTTAREAARRFWLLRQEGLSTADIAGAMGVYATERATSRSAVVAETESVRVTRRAMLETYRRNEVTTYEYRTQNDSSVCMICRPYHRRRFSESDLPLLLTLIPQHVGCRCYHLPVVEIVPEEVWTGE